MTEQEQMDLTNLDGSAWVRLEGSTFQMGSSAGRDDARPVHEVSVSSFRISRFPVTNAQYAEFVADTETAAPEHWPNGAAPEGMAAHPVTNLSWHDADAFCNWLTGKAGSDTDGGAHLPTEAQWEFAARGTEGREYPWGNDEPTAAHANFQASGAEDTTPVDAFSMGATPDGIHDLAGNVRQWCRDWYGRYPESPEVDPTGPGEGSERVIRGSSYVDAPGTLRTGYRFNIGPSDRYGFVGFRVAWSTV